ncbi:MAG: 2-C-methyl-D-erythritol 4-phosphate cytidylyltransferase [Acidobacteria bacterium]|nr:2-C-methyl-D-erythritol 4-phosphate cytidylyltransferase [Acidobacteriota bacterium]MBI1984100.1 2-C-methyl-D-erythritol 4-phosphate cytidylyltransferase [Acidobacteriota bacterium]
MGVLAIIPAAGMGVRMGGGTPKQFLSLDGVPIFVHTLRKFAAADSIDEIFLALRPEVMERAQKDLEREHCSKPLRLVSGGATRQETVARALAEAPPETDLVVVHDAVRPFVELEMIRKVVEAARKEGAAILGIPSVDTVKQVERQTILGTVPRERIVLAQTPQAFRYEIIREAFARAAADGFNGTDESSLVERLGHSVTVLMGSDRNIKITKPSDLPIARLYIAQEKSSVEG